MCYSASDRRFLDYLPVSSNFIQWRQAFTFPLFQATVLKLPSITNRTGEPDNGSFHTVANLQSETSEIIDTRMTAPVDRFITVALATYNKQVAEIEADLWKLVYTMKTFPTTAGHMRKDWLLPSAHVVIG